MKQIIFSCIAVLLSSGALGQDVSIDRVDVTVNRIMDPMLVNQPVPGEGPRIISVEEVDYSERSKEGTLKVTFESDLYPVWFTSDGHHRLGTETRQGTTTVVPRVYFQTLSNGQHQYVLMIKNQEGEGEHGTWNLNPKKQ